LGYNTRCFHEPPLNPLLAEEGKAVLPAGTGIHINSQPVIPAKAGIYYNLFGIFINKN